MQNNIIDKDAFIEIVAKRTGFIKKDVKEILDAMINVFVESVINNIEIKIRGFGKMYCQIIPPRLGKNGQELPEAKRVIFKLAETIRYANKK